MSTSNKLIFVTGGAGFVGSHTVLELLKYNYDVVVFDNMSNAVCNEVNQNSLPESLARVEVLAGRKLCNFIKGDLLDFKALDYIFGQYKFDAVIHFAALKAVGESCQLPLSYYRNNFIGTINLLEAMKAHGVYSFIFSSSATVYGKPQYLPIDESHPIGIGVTNPYGKTKCFIEELLKDISAAQKGWCIVSLRYFNPVGAHESGEIGEDPQGIPNNLMPFISQVAVGRRQFLNVFGNDFQTPDGSGVRDYIHIMDLAKGHVKALEKMINENWSGCHVYNLGTGRGYSVLEVVAAFEKAAGVKVPYKIVERRAGDVDSLYANCELAKEKLDWVPKYDIIDMCTHTWQWQSKNPNGFRTSADGSAPLNETLPLSNCTYNVSNKMSTNDRTNGHSSGNGILSND